MEKQEAIGKRLKVTLSGGFQAPPSLPPPKKAELNKVAQQSGAGEAQHALVMGSGPGVSPWTPPPPFAPCRAATSWGRVCWVTPADAHGAGPFVSSTKKHFSCPRDKNLILSRAPWPRQDGEQWGGSSWPSPPWSWAFWGGPKG